MRNATTPNPPSFAALVQQFFTEHLVRFGDYYPV